MAMLARLLALNLSWRGFKMPLIPINPPPGMYKNGTPYTRKFRWEDGNLVRWHDGAVRPIGGWQRRQSGGTDIAALVADPTLAAVRDIFSWRDNNQNANTVFGSNLALYYMSANGTVTDITYSGYAALNSTKDASTVAGYGQNDYGDGAYGAGNNLNGAEPNPPDRWYFDNFGEVLLTGARNNGAVQELDLIGPTLSAVTNAPSGIQDLVVTNQRQVMVIGGGGQPRRLQASDIENRTSWTPAIANQAIDRTIPGTGKLLRCINVLRQTLILGETDAHVARYIGPPYVYSVDLAGDNCGPLAAEAVASTEKFAVWWGDRNFWLFDGSVQHVECTVIDFLYDDIDLNQASKICCFANTGFTEVWWLYQSKSSTTTEVDSYVAWDYRENHWSTGRINRTAGQDKGVLQTPLMVNADGEIYNHELDGVIPLGEGNIFVETGAIELSNGEQNVAVRYLYPDNQDQQDVTFELITRQFPNATEYTYGPYDYNNPVPVRALGRSVKMKVNFQDATSELGIIRMEVAGRGTGRR
jgi:hypothetical protein